MKNAVAIVSVAFAWAACSAPIDLARMLLGEPTQTPEATIPPTPMPSSTSRPTIVPSRSPTPDLQPTPTPVPTFPIPTLSPTPTALSALDCRLDWQSPGSGIEFDAKESFTVGWKVTNTGSQTWSPGSVEFTYVSGARLHRESVEQLESSVPPGQSVILSAEMRAPRNSTLYTTYWSLRQDDIFFCRVSLSIYVE